MATIATDPAFVSLLTQIGGSYVDSSGVTRDITLNFTYPENGNSELKTPLTKREYFALVILSGKIGSTVFDSIAVEELVFQSVAQADMLISTLNNVPIP